MTEKLGESLNLGITAAAIGSPNDTESNNTIAGKVDAIMDHLHSKSMVYPSLAAGVVVTGSVTAWVLGSIVQVIPINTITRPFDIHGIQVEAYNANDTFEIVLYSDNGGVNEIGRIRVTRITNVGASPEVPFQTIILPANNGVWAKVATRLGTSNTVTISLRLHTYS